MGLDRFDTPYWLAAGIVVLLGLALSYAVRGADRRPRPALLFSRIPAVLRSGRTWRTRLRREFRILRALILIAIVVALARPQSGRSESRISSEGIDMMLVVDTSNSMVAEDFGQEKTRLHHVVDVMREFVDRRIDDRIGLVSFGRNAWTRCPMTLDHGLLAQFLTEVRDQWLRATDSLARKAARGDPKMQLAPDEEDLMGTAIGDGLVAATARLQKSTAKSKIIILLSDGESNAGDTAPEAAADLAASCGVKVYTVGAGSNGPVLVSQYDRLGRKVKVQTRFALDEATLTKIAETTGGRYFHAGNRESLEAVFTEIDRLERSKIESQDFREWDEHFMPFAWAALGLLLLEAGLAATVLRSVH